MWLPLTRAGFRLKGESYQDYLYRKGNIKNTGKEIAKTLGEQFGLSKKSTEIMYGVVAGAAKLAKDKEIEIPSTRLVDRNGFTVDAEGHANILKDSYGAKLTGTLEDTFGVKGLDLTARARAGLERGTPSFRDASVGASYKVGDDSSIYGEVSPERITVGGKLTFKKGGKVKKKRKTKKYSKGCVVRTAKY